jgi:hypothetical protein
MRNRWRAVVVTVLAVTAMLPGHLPATAATDGGYLNRPNDVVFHSQRAGTAWHSIEDLKIENLGNDTLTLHSIALIGAQAGEFWLDDRCPDTLEPGEKCSVGVWMVPFGIGTRSATIRILHDGTNASPTDVNVSGFATCGVYVATTTGSVYGYGDADTSGGSRIDPPPKWTTTFALNSGILDLEATPTGDGVWLVAGDGGIFTFGDAVFFGSTGELRLNQPIVGMAATPTGRGYWLVASDGGIFSFGDAAFFGSTGDLLLNRPIVGMAATPTGRGYWLVASDGGIFSFGDAAFFGSTGDIPLNQPIVAMARTPRGAGYWLLASDGGLFTFGDAAFHGSELTDPRSTVKSRAVGMAVAPGGSGYWVAYARQTVRAFGDTGPSFTPRPPAVVAAITPSAPVVWWAEPAGQAAVREVVPPPPPTRVP